MRSCHKCRYPNPSDATFCGYCGVALGEPQVSDAFETSHSNIYSTQSIPTKSNQRMYIGSLPKVWLWLAVGFDSVAGTPLLLAGVLILDVQLFFVHILVGAILLSLAYGILSRNRVSRYGQICLSGISIVLTLFISVALLRLFWFLIHIAILYGFLFDSELIDLFS